MIEAKEVVIKNLKKTIDNKFQKTDRKIIREHKIGSFIISLLTIIFGLIILQISLGVSILNFLVDYYEIIIISFLLPFINFLPLTLNKTYLKSYKKKIAKEIDKVNRFENELKF